VGAPIGYGRFCIKFPQQNERWATQAQLSAEPLVNNCIFCVLGVDEDGCVVFLYSGNRKASLVYSGKTIGGNNCATIMGSKATLFVSLVLFIPGK
jgi:hypothetical protein